MSRLTFISAGAGSGKTHTLTHTLGALLETNTVRPAGVIATTFTKKAATELRERVRLHLLESGRFDLANAMGQARIGTVNSICGGLVERFAFEAGLATRQQVLEEGQAELLIREAIDAALTGEQVGELSRLAYRLGIEDWGGVLANLVNQARANDIDPALLPGFAQENAEDLLNHFPHPVQDDLTGQALAAIEDALPELRHAAAQDGAKKNTKDYLALLEDLGQKLAGGYAKWSEWISACKKLPEKKFHSHAETIQALLRQCPRHSQLHADIRVYLDSLFQLCEAALSHYAERKRSLGVVDFADQEHLLLKLLERPEVCDTLREELDLLLVDEFQDTSPIQLALFIKLADLAKQTYWVGDIKQAIYGFRGSDTALMKAILKDLPAFEGKKETLDCSWRSRPALVQLVNAAFVPAFAPDLEEGDVALQPIRTEVPNLPALANWVLTDSNAAKRAEALAEGVSNLLKAGHCIPAKGKTEARPLRASDIAVLSRSHAGVNEFAQALRKAGVPVATGQAGLLSTPEVLLALACLRRLNDPGDTIATAEILSLADCEAPESWLADRLTYLQQEGNDKFWRETGDAAHPLLQRLATLRQERPLLAPRETLERLLADGHLPQRVLAWRQDPAVGRIRLANLEALLALADQYEDSCRSAHRAATVSGLLLWLDVQAEAGQDKLATPGVDAVQVMTHHAAKGLEWPVVILADLEKEARNRLWSVTTQSRQDIDARAPLKDRFIRYWPWPFGKNRKDIDSVDEINQSETAQRFQQESREENLRLLYVSMTRPRDLLILARNGKKGEAGWVNELNAGWLLQEIGSTLRLPDGQEIPYQYQELTAPETARDAQPVCLPVHWFATTPAIERLPLSFNPSRAEKTQAKVLEKIRIGDRMTVEQNVEWDNLGTALHACIAASISDGLALDEQSLSTLLDNHGVSDAVVVSQVRSQIAAFQTWLQTRWPDAKPIAEAAATLRLDNGQQMNGRIDLLLETAQGYILIDHKSSPLSMDKWDGLAEEYSGQLAAYAQAVEKVTGKSVIEQWLFLPVAGAGVRIEKLYM